MSIVLGYDPVTLREKVDLQALGARLDELGPLRSSEALNEKVGLLRLAGRLDEAMDVANAAVRMARFGGDREALLFARVRRAQVQQYQGKADAALVELSDCVAEASGHDWPEAEAFALQHRGKVYFDLEELDRALRDFRQAHTIRTRIQTNPHQIEASLVALTVTEGLLGHAHGTTATGASDATAAPAANADAGSAQVGRGAGAEGAGAGGSVTGDAVAGAAVAEDAAAEFPVAEAAASMSRPAREAAPTRVPTAAWAYAQAVSARAAEEQAAAERAAAEAPAPRGGLWSRVAGGGSRRESARQSARQDGARSGSARHDSARQDSARQDSARGERRYDAARRDPAERAAEQRVEERAADQHMADQHGSDRHEGGSGAPRQQAAASAVRRDPAAPDAITTGSLALHSTLFDIEPGETDG